MKPILCDSHMHVFSRSVVPAGASYVPPAKDLNDYLEEASLGKIGRAVIIQASVDGVDNSRLVDTLTAQQAIELRGVAMIDEQTQDLESLAKAGVRALRIQDRTRLGLNDLERLPQLGNRAAEVDWHVELNTEPARYSRLQALLKGLPQGQQLVLDHFGHCDPNSTSDIEGLCRLLGSGRIWVKLAPTRVSKQVGQYQDLFGLVETLASQYTERCLWGSDWPHVMTAEPLPKTSDMLDFMARVLTQDQFLACLSDNPERLYRF